MNQQKTPNANEFFCKIISMRNNLLIICENDGKPRWCIADVWKGTLLRCSSLEFWWTQSACWDRGQSRPWWGDRSTWSLTCWQSWDQWRRSRMWTGRRSWPREHWPGAHSEAGKGRDTRLSRWRLSDRDRGQWEQWSLTWWLGGCHWAADDSRVSIWLGYVRIVHCEDIIN